MRIFKLREENYPKSQSSETAKLVLRRMFFYRNKKDLAL